MMTSTCVTYISQSINQSISKFLGWPK